MIASSRQRSFQVSKALPASTSAPHRAASVEPTKSQKHHCDRPVLASRVRGGTKLQGFRLSHVFLITAVSGKRLIGNSEELLSEILPGE
jgi:hypothetical protein